MINKPFSAMILAAGFGKRLNPLTLKMPKPMIKINNITLLQNTINILLSINCKEIVINTHYKHEYIKNFIDKNYDHKNIILSYEKEILDTAGGVKNALPLFSNNAVLVVNSDVFWREENLKDIIKLINNYKAHEQCRLLLVPEDKVHGISKKKGDFVLEKNIVKRCYSNKFYFYYSGLQILYLNILKDYSQKKFSFNLLWDDLILKQSLYGSVMNSQWYHVGDIKGLKEAKNSIT